MLHLELKEIAASSGIDPFAPDATAHLTAVIEQRGIGDRIRKATRTPADALRLILCTASAACSQREPATPVEFVATVPSGVAGGTRPTSIVIEEICRAARRSLLLMGYQIRSSSGIDGHVNSAASRGVMIAMVCDREDTGWREVYRSWLPGAPMPRVFVNSQGTDILGKMHCKVLCADEQDLLITSANFTWPGLNANIEYGVRLSDANSGRQAVAFVQYLVREGLLVDAIG